MNRFEDIAGQKVVHPSVGKRQGTASWPELNVDQTDGMGEQSKVKLKHQRLSRVAVHAVLTGE